MEVKRPGPMRFLADRMGIRAKFSLLFYLVTLLAVSVIGYYGYHHASGAYREKALAVGVGYVNELGRDIEELLYQAPEDLRFLSRFYALNRYLYWQDLGDPAKADFWEEVTRDTLRGLMAARKRYYKVRYIDAQGLERIKARFDAASGKVRFEGGRELQERGDRDYFRLPMGLAAGQYYVSPMDLNREHGEIEQPQVPVIRIAQPVVGGNGTKYGVLVLNLFADSVLELIREAMERREGRHFYLIDGDGHYLFRPDGGQAFNHLLGRGESFRDREPELFERISSQREGTLTSQGRIVSFARVHPHPSERDRYWTLVGMITEAEALASLRDFELVFILLVGLVLVVVLAASRYYVGGLVRPLLAVTRQLQSLGRGEVVRESIHYPARDEIRQMLDSTELLVGNMEVLADRADAIARGDLTGDVVLLSDNDRLGSALDNMTRQLRENHHQDGRRNWLKDGIGQLNRSLSGDLGPEALADQAVAVVGRYLEAGRGVCYVYDPERQLLELLGSYMHSEREHLGSRFHLGEGAVGQAARERKPIALHGIEGDTQPVTTGTVRVLPRHTYTLPLLRDRELIGVLELAALEPFGELKREFLDDAAEVIAGFLFAALQRGRIQALLGEAEAAAREAREQSERLQLANNQMEEQQQQLQQQAEELQQANAQMEEQQQQLQQQTEELQQANAQMEEQQQQLRQQTRELEARNRELTRSRDELDLKANQLEEASRYKSEFLANMSHELRTPLNSIILLSKMLAMNEEGHLAEEEVKRARVVHQAGEELLRLINDILDLSKIESGRMEVTLQEVASAALADEFRDLFQAAAAERGLELKIDDHIGGPFVTDHDKLAQILRNLLSNAIKFTHDGSVTLRMERREDSELPLRIAVVDTGIGVPPEKQRLIFEAFQQADGSTSRQYGGTGLGLSISLRFAQLLGGTIELESRPGEGSQFVVLLPEPSLDGQGVAPAPLPATPRPAAVPQARPAAVPAAAANAPVSDDRANLRSGDAVILVIDDDPGFTEAVADLNRKRGYKTLVARTGEEGLRMAKTYRPGGILLDLGLPDRDGAEVLRELKATRELRRIPVYVVSGRDRQQDLLKRGIVGYLQKPVDDQQLVAAEAEILARAGEGQRRILVLVGESLDAGQVGRLVGGEGLQVEAVAEVDQALARVGELGADLVIVDLDRADDQDCHRFCPALREAYPDVPLMLYGQRPVDGDEEARLRGYTDSIILKTPRSDERMLENIERFLHQVPDEGGEAKPLPAGGRRLEGKRVLVVDDDPRNLFVITSALESQGARVDSALNGRKALAYLEKNRPDMVFMDIMMPEMDGYQAIQAIRADARLQGLPVVALTAKALRDDRDKALAAGADDYLAKPVDFEVLINMARVWCEPR